MLEAVLLAFIAMIVLSIFTVALFSVEDQDDHMAPDEPLYAQPVNTQPLKSKRKLAGVRHHRATSAKRQSLPALQGIASARFSGGSR